MFKALYAKAGQIESAAHALQEAEKSGVLRGGTTGCVLPTGEVAGQCHRKALIRYLGLQKDAGSSAWFDMGYANEFLWEDKIKKAWPGIVRVESDYPIAWEVDGIQITGRPDMVLCDLDGKPVAGVELKAMGAINSAAGVFYKNQPKVEHLLQAAHYSSQVGVPFYLVYTCFVKGPLPYYAQKEYNAKELNPFIKEFKVELNSVGYIQYTTEEGRVFTTKYSFDGIKDFYRLVSSMAEEKDLYLRYKGMDVEGKRMPYNVCTYCEYKSMCDSYEGNFDRWVDECARLQITEEPEEGGIAA